MMPCNAKCRPANWGHSGSLAAVKELLQRALAHARDAECPSLVRKIQSALKSHEGASRHMKRRLDAGGCRL